MSKRSGSDTRKRTCQVGVRLSADEMELLRAHSKGQGLTPAAMLRETYIQSRPVWTAIRSFAVISTPDAVGSQGPEKEQP